MIIGIYTFFDSWDNYGQVLQAYALQAYLKQQGHDVFFINFSMREAKSKTNSRQEHLSFKKFLQDQIAQITKTYRRKKRIEFNKKYPRDFDGFRQKNFSIFPSSPYISFQDIKQAPPIADAYICGSDQVWNTDNSELATIAYLNFGPQEALRIAYAASFGKFNDSSEHLRFLNEQLKRFNAVSLREDKGEILCRKAGRNDCCVVLDPTFLLQPDAYRSLWEKAPQNKSDKKHVFCYFLNFKNAEDVAWKKIISFTKQRELDYRLTISSGFIPAYDRIGDVEYFAPNPDTWLQAIDTCEYMVTNSFHGVVFAIIFHKAFLYVPFRGKADFMNERIFNLLKTLHLEERILDYQQTIDSQISRTIHWELVDSILNNLRSKSYKFIETALSSHSNEQ